MSLPCIAIFISQSKNIEATIAFGEKLLDATQPNVYLFKTYFLDKISSDAVNDKASVLHKPK